MPNATETPIATLKQMAVDRLNWANGFSDAIIDSLTDEQLMARAGGAGNHAAWVMGHVAASNDQIVAAMSGRPAVLPESFHKTFSGGSKPSNNRSDYPSRAELKAALKKVRQHTIKWVQSLDEETALAPAPEPLRPFAPDAITTPFTIVAHDLYHLGQVASVRASLGLEPLMR